MPGALVLFELLGMSAAAGRILDLLLPSRDVGQIARKLTARAPKVDLEGDRVLPRPVLDHPLQRRVRDKAAVPVEFTFDLDRREAGRKRSAGHHVLGPDRMRFIVEVDEIARPYVHCADAEAHSAGIDAVESQQAAPESS